MRSRFIRIILLSILLNAGPSPEPVLAALHYEQTQPGEYSREEGEPPFMPLFLVMVMIAAIIALICIGAGLILMALGIFALVGLVALGVVSSSVAVGIYRKSLQSGFRTLVLTGSIAAGGIGGLLIAWFIYLIVFGMDLLTVLLIGGIGGLLAGAVFGLLALWLIRYLTRLLNAQFRSFKSNVR